MTARPDEPPPLETRADLPEYLRWLNGVRLPDITATGVRNGVISAPAEPRPSSTLIRGGADDAG